MPRRRSRFGFEGRSSLRRRGRRRRKSGRSQRDGLSHPKSSAAHTAPPAISVTPKTSKRVSVRVSIQLLRMRASIVGLSRNLHGKATKRLLILASLIWVRGAASSAWQLCADHPSDCVCGDRVTANHQGRNWIGPLLNPSASRWVGFRAGGGCGPADTFRQPFSSADGQKPPSKAGLPVATFSRMCEPDHNTLPAPVGECPRGGLAS